MLLKPMGKTMKAYACQVTGADAKTLQVSYGCIWEKEKPTGIQQFAWMQVAIPKMQDHEQVVWQSITPEVTLNWCAVTGNDAFSDGADAYIDSTEELQTYLEAVLQPDEIPAYLQQYNDAFCRIRIGDSTASVAKCHAIGIYSNSKESGFGNSALLSAGRRKTADQLSGICCGSTGRAFRSGKSWIHSVWGDIGR